MKEVLTIKEASEILNCTEVYLRDAIRFELLDIGKAVKLPNKKNYHYFVFTEKLNKLIGGSLTND